MRIAKNHNILAIVSSMIVFTVFSGFCLTQVTIKARAVTESANASVTVGSACTLAKSITSAHTASITNGSYYGDSGIGETLLQANCNDASGFAIYAIGYTGNESGANYLRDNTLYSTYNNTYDIATGTGTSGNSNWSMKLTSVSNADTPVIQNSYDSYHNVPSEYTLVANKASGTTIDDGARVKVTYTAYVSGAQPAGVYEGKVKYVMVHPANHVAPYTPQAISCPSRKVCYYPNTNDYEGTMGQQTISSSSNTSITLLASNFSRTGYGFAGWSDVYDYDTNPNAHFYGPQEDITFTAGQYTGTNNGLSLYAVWVESVGSLQTNATAVCNGLTQAPTDGTANLDSVSALTDQRDNQTYAIAKLADGKCWMIENLRLESTAEHNSDGTLAQGYHSSFAGLANAESANFSDSTTANSLYTTESNIEGKNTISGSWKAYRFPRYNNLNTQSRASNPISNSFSNNNTGGGMYSYGNYYTWHAAIADTTHNGSNNTSSDTTSICPNGWHLPKGGDKSNEANNEFWSLVVTGINSGINPANYDSDTRPYYTDTPEGANASNALRAYPNNFLYSGRFVTSSTGYRGYNGGYWSSTVEDTYYSYGLYLYSSEVFPGTFGITKYEGFSIRCLAS